MKKNVLTVSLVCGLTMFLMACGSTADVNEKNETTVTQEEVLEGTMVESTTEEMPASEEEGSTVEQTSSAAEITSALQGEFTIDIPEGFIEQAEGEYVAPNYPDELSSMNYYKAPNDGSFNESTAILFMSQLESQVEAIYDTDVELQVPYKNFFELEGRETLSYEMRYEVNGEQVIQMQSIIADRSYLYFVTCTEMNNEGYYDALKASMDSIRFE